jgi:phosphoglycerate kinase
VPATAPRPHPPIEPRTDSLMTAFKTLDDLDARGRTVLVRLDLNVPMKDGRVTDVTRIERILPTVRELRDEGAKVVILAHLGRPKGRRESSMSLEPVAVALGDALGARVAFAEDCVGEAAESAVGRLDDGDVLLLENLRFHAGEEKNETEFADALAALGEAYVNDAFSCSHRAHASVVGLAERLPAHAGRLMQAELEALTKALSEPERPVAAVIGGAKISTKLDLLSNLIERADVLILGGGMANTFLLAKGFGIGRSLAEADMVGTAREIIDKAARQSCEIMLPSDGRTAKEFKEDAGAEVHPVEETPEDVMILDIGPDSERAMAARIESCRTVVWNGPLGAFELPPFDQGTNAVARAVAHRTEADGLLSVAGGGDTLAALRHAGVLEKMSYVSTAGGAFLEWLEGKDLPGVAALSARG